jgi:hypothetical protein
MRRGANGLGNRPREWERASLVEDADDDTDVRVSKSAFFV